MYPKLSIIIPVFNAEKYIDRCIESILEQEYENYELILVNDGSTDSSEQICKKYLNQNNHIRYIFSENKGASHARNLGIRIAKGELIWFIDADDWIEPNSLSQLISEFNSDLLFFGFFKIYENGQRSQFRIQSMTETFSTDIDKVIHRLFVSSEKFFGFTWNKLFKREIIHKYNLQFNENLIVKEDEVFTFEYCRHINSLTISSATPYDYRILSNSTSHSKHGKRNKLNLAKCIANDIFPGILNDDLKYALGKDVSCYSWEAMMEEAGSDRLNEAVEFFISWQKTNWTSDNSSFKMKIFSIIPSLSLKKLIIRNYLMFKQRRLK